MTTAFNVFLGRVHQLLQAAYISFTAKELGVLNSKTEPDITAALKMRMQQLIDDGAIPGISRAWSVEDNSPENLDHLPLSKQPPAKKRKMPDLKVRFGGQRQALYFRFESKGLAGSGDFNNLISHEDGLGRFLRRIYGRGDHAGGVLGYVQLGSVEFHAERIEKALAASPVKYRVAASGGWMAASWKDGPQCCFRVLHSKEDGSIMMVFYSFLLFPAKNWKQLG